MITLLPMLEPIQQLHAEIAQFQAPSLALLDTFWQRFLSKKGQIAQLFSTFKGLSTAEKKQWGQQLNLLKHTAQQKFDQLHSALKKNEEKNIAPAQDLTLPPATAALGSLHPLTKVAHQIIHLLEKIGFHLADGPEIEDEWHNFTALNFPPNHPARDMQDTFFVGPGQVLRTHTSSVQVRVMKNQPLPIRTISMGRVFRNEAISARAHCIFHQLEGLYISQNVNFIALKETLAYLVNGLFKEPHLRFRPSYFPFTSPSVELDIDCQLCRGKGCNVCKYTGWVEVLGAGMVDPQVLTNSGLDPQLCAGFAFGLGIERLAMLQYQINDLRLFTENDIRFLGQFIG